MTPHLNPRITMISGKNILRIIDVWMAIMFDPGRKL